MLVPPPTSTGCNTCRFGDPESFSADRCPECGKPRSDRRQRSFTPQTFPKGSSTLRCINCRYDLTGLAPAGNCPECGIPIAVTHAPDTIAEAPPQHQSALTLGAKLTTLGAATLTAASILQFFHLEQLGSGPRPYSPPILWISTSSTLIAGSAASFFGWLILTKPNTRRHRQSRRSVLRITTRIICPLACVITAALTALAALVWLIDNNPDADYPAPAIAGTLIAGLTLLCATIAFIPAHLHIASLAKRLDAPILARRATVYACFTAAIIIILAPLTLGISLLLAPALLAALTLEASTNLVISLIKLQRQPRP